MKIKDFQQKVRIGTKILFEQKLYEVKDIIRARHSVVINRSRVVRCSEIELAEEGGGQ